MKIVLKFDIEESWELKVFISFLILNCPNLTYQGDTKVKHYKVDKLVLNFLVDLKRNLQFRPKNIYQKCLSTLKNSTLSRPPDTLTTQCLMFMQKRES